MRIYAYTLQKRCVEYLEKSETVTEKDISGSVHARLVKVLRITMNKAYISWLHPTASSGVA